MSTRCVNIGVDIENYKQDSVQLTLLYHDASSFDVTLHKYRVIRIGFACQFGGETLKIGAGERF